VQTLYHVVAKRRPTKPVPTMYPKHYRWRVDYDYLDRLTPDEAAWLAQFTDEEVAGDFRYEEPFTEDQDDRRAVWREKKRSERNFRSNGEPSSLNRFEQASGPQPEISTLEKASAYHPDSPSAPDLAPTPEYLGTLEYKDAVAALRDAIDNGQKRRARGLQRYIASLGGAIDEGELDDFGS
jgi:hypothetical protein